MNARIPLLVALVATAFSPHAAGTVYYASLGLSQGYSFESPYMAFDTDNDYTAQGQSAFVGEITSGQISFPRVELSTREHTRFYEGIFQDPNTFVNKSINTTLTFNPRVFNASSNGPLTLFPVAGGGFLIDPPHGAGEVEITGSYRLVGPTQTVTGTFAVPADPQPFTFQGNRIFNVSETSFTAGIFRSEAIDPRGPPHTLVNATFDGIPIRIDLTEAPIYVFGETSQTAGQLVFRIVPEPSLVALLGVGALGMWRTRRR
jgi:PEP-CTERM motif